MKLMSHLLLISLLLFSGLFAQTVCSRIANLRLYEDAFMWDIQIKRTDDWLVPVLGHYDYYFFVNADVFSTLTPAIEWLHPDLEGNPSYKIRTGYALDKTHFWMALDYDYHPGGQVFYPPTPDQYSTIITVSLPFISNPAGETGIDWHSFSTAGTDSSLNPLVQTLEGSGDITIDIQLVSLKADLEDKNIYIRWQTESERSVLGYHILKKINGNGEFVKANNSLLPAKGGTTDPADYVFIDSDVQPHTDYTYQLLEVDINGSESISATVNIRTDAWVPDRYYLDSNYPNPFNPSTTIQFGIPEQSHVRLQIFNIRGELIRVLWDEIMDAGIHDVKWDGRNAIGHQVSTGVYFYRLQSGGFDKIVKMLLTK